MTKQSVPVDLRKVKVLPLATRQSLSRADALIRNPESAPPALPSVMRKTVEGCAKRIRAARAQGRSVILMYGAHLVKNGAQAIVQQLISKGCLTHLATNGAGTIHDWELAFLGRTEESVRKNVPTGTFGTWDETGRSIHLAILAGALRSEGYGRSLGRFIAEDGVDLPTREELEQQIRSHPTDPITPARADLLQAMVRHQLPAGRLTVKHPWAQTSILACAFRTEVPFTVHPGIGYDIIATHPMFNGAAIGRAAELDFRTFAQSVDGLDGGVVLSIGSAIMAPQVFEKTLSCVNNLRLQANRPIVKDHSIYVVDIQDGGHWDWSQGEPPKDNPAYYLRFCKSFARMGGTMTYAQCDNAAFLHNLLHLL